MDKAEYNRGLFFHFQNPANFALAFYLIHITVYDTLRNVNPVFSLVATLGNYIFLILVINCLPVIRRSFTKSALICVVIFALVSVISIMIAQNDEIHLVVISSFFRFGFPCFLIGLSICDTDDLINKLEVSSALILLCIGLSVFVFKSNSILDSAYSQDMGYEALVPFVIFTGMLLKKRTVCNIVGMIASIIFVVMSGARGPLLCLILSGVVLFLIYAQMDIKKLLAVAVVGGLCAVIVFINYQSIIQWLISVFDSFGVSTRILYGLLNKDLSDDVMRGRLRSFAWEYAKNHVIGGTGFVNDRQLIYESLLVGVAQGASGTYVHNFFLELMMQFGLIPGLFMSVLFSAKLIKSFSRKYSFNTKLFVSMLLSIAFWPLMISRSYLSVAYFYLLSGFLLGINRFSKEETGGDKR